MTEKLEHPAILVWRFSDAPDEYKKLSHHDGDEDWVAVVPREYAAQWIGWIDSQMFGVCDTSSHELENGSKVFIGAH